MARRRVMVELRHNPDLGAMAFATAEDVRLDVAAVPKVLGVKYDEQFPPKALPGCAPRAQAESIYDTCPFDLYLDTASQCRPAFNGPVRDHQQVACRRH
jgi:hypothetical protein